MAQSTRLPLHIAALAAALLAGACAQGGLEPNPEGGGNETDPALTSALEDQILVDPALTQQSNRNTVRPPETPLQAPYPAGSAANAATLQQNCPGEFDYDAAWAGKLPQAFPVYPGGRVTDAAGKDGRNCSVRVVTFRTGATWQQLTSFYSERAASAGYSAERQARGADRVVGGTNPASGGAYYVVVTPMQGGSEAALFVSEGG